MSQPAHIAKPAPARIDLDGARAALFFDVDGTLVNTDFAENQKRAEELGDAAGDDFVKKAPSPAVREAIHQLTLAGHKAFICTGRTTDTIFDSIASLDVAGIVSGAGSCVTMGGRVLYERVIEPELLDRTAQILFDLHVPVVFEGNAGSAVMMPGNEVFANIPGVELVYSLDEFRNFAAEHTFEKFSYHDTALEQLRDHLDFFRAHYNVCDLGIGGGEMTLAGVNKGMGIRHAVELLGEGPWMTFGFGDSENDIEMMREVDVAVAMGNALPSIKEISDVVCDTVANDGVATALAAFGLI